MPRSLSTATSPHGLPSLAATDAAGSALRTVASLPQRALEAYSYEDPDVPDLTKPPPAAVAAATDALGPAAVAALQTLCMDRILVLVDEKVIKRRDVEKFHQTMVANELVAAAAALRDVK